MRPARRLLEWLGPNAMIGVDEHRGDSAAEEATMRPSGQARHAPASCLRGRTRSRGQPGKRAFSASATTISCRSRRPDLQRHRN